ncbi:hypothetical protein F5Y01DRAFT_320341 [Xylaria sp. FL0043]|nr:hypothetical protein F5Y01DRAFT_320341 [Xylaria sp. FL0043]
MDAHNCREKTSIPSTYEITDAINIGHCSLYLTSCESSEETADNSDHYSDHPVESEEEHTESCPDQMKSSSLIIPLYNSIINLFNLSMKRNSSADDAHVEDAIRLIKSLPTIQHNLVTNPTRKLTPSQYEQLLERIENDKDCSNRLRFEYTHSTQQFEIRLTTALHAGVVGELNEQSALWRAELWKSSNSEVSSAAGTLRPYGNEDIRIAASEGASDLKSPDGGIKHVCSLFCLPALVFEIGFSHNTKKELKEKAEAYILRSKGEIRTVIGVWLGEMYKAECKNEKRLRKLYRANATDEITPQSYPTDDKNVTGEASILVWRAMADENNTVVIKRVQEKKFRDATGKAIQPAALRISLEDCVCKGVIHSVRKHETSILEISSEALCNIIEENLGFYRTKRAQAIREQMQEEERLRRATETSMHKDASVLGRVIEQGRMFSARISNGRVQRGLE